MPGAFAALKGATIVGYGLGIFAAALLTGVAATAKYTGDTRTAVTTHERADVERNGATVIRDSALINEVRGLRHDNNVNAKKERCILAAETTAQRRACKTKAFVEGDDQ